MRGLSSFWALVLAYTSGAFVLACGGDDDYDDPKPAKDAGQAPDSTVSDGGTEAALDASSDAPATDAPSEAAPPPARALVSWNNGTTSELVVVDPTTLAVQGRLTFPGFIGATYSWGLSDPYLLMQSADVVAKLDRDRPWIVKSSWSVRLDDRADGGYAYADPAAIAVVGNKAYVPRYTRNALAVLDVSQTVDGGAPLKTIDLSSLADPADSDGIVDMTSAIYVPSKNRVFVLLGNVDRNRVVNNGFDILCTNAKPNLVAIDPSTDQVVSFGGNGPGGGIQLSGYNPVLGPPMIYEPGPDRLLVLSAGCNVEQADGGAGPITRRRVEAVSLTAKTTSTALDLDANGFPGALVPFGPGRAVVGFFGDARVWDTQSSTLGPSIAGAPDLFAHDGRGALVGPRTDYLADGGTEVKVVRILVGDAGAIDASSLANPFTDPNGFSGGVEVWPTP